MNSDFKISNKNIFVKLDTIMLSEGIQRTKNLFGVENCEKPTKNSNFSKIFFLKNLPKFFSIIN